jgi:hypothetical protein
MRLARAKQIINKYSHGGTWHCGRAEIHATGKDENPRFDRRIEVYLNLSKYSIDIKKIAALLNLLDRLGKPVKFSLFRQSRKQSRKKKRPLICRQCSNISLR